MYILAIVRRREGTGNFMIDIKKIEIPENPGVYLMKKQGKVIYVGKAKNLKNRVSSYFNREHESEKTKELVKNIENIEFIICNSEVDALILENNLIKKYMPKYNILLKDEKTYPYIKISREKFPNIQVIRTTKALDTKSGIYFGPYPQGGWMLKKMLVKIFKLRDCTRDMNKKYSRPCLKYYMKMCIGPCVYKDREKEYNTFVEQAKQVLKGQGKLLVEELNKKMNLASEKMEFENAIIYREQIKEIESTILNNQVTEYGKELDEDIFNLKIEKERVFICVLNVRDGKILGKISTNLSLKDKIYENVLESMILSFYTKHPLPNSIVFQSEYEKESEQILEALKKIKNRKIEFHFPKIKSRRKELLEMGELNLERDIENYYRKKSVVEEGLYKLYTTLQLTRYPRKIECFDISNTQGKDGISDLLSLAEREEEVYKYGEKEPYIFSKDQEALKIFQRVRDEAHRFGVTYHRKLRSKRVLKSELDDIEGVGAKRKTVLLKEFGSIERIKNESIESLTRFVPRKIAENILEKLKK